MYTVTPRTKEHEIYIPIGVFNEARKEARKANGTQTQEVRPLRQPILARSCDTHRHCQTIVGQEVDVLLAWCHFPGKEHWFTLPWHSCTVGTKSTPIHTK